MNILQSTPDCLLTYQELEDRVGKEKEREQQREKQREKERVRERMKESNPL